MMKHTAMILSLLVISSSAKAGMMVDVEEMDRYVENFAAQNPNVNLDDCEFVGSATQSSTQAQENFATDAGYLTLNCDAAVAASARGPGDGFFKRIFGKRDRGFRGSVERKNRKYRIRAPKPQGCHTGR